MNVKIQALKTLSVSLLALGVASCGETTQSSALETGQVNAKESAQINPKNWPVVKTAALDPKVERRIDSILAKMTLEQKVGQVIQGDTNSITPEEVKQYRLGSVLSGGNSAPGDLPYADAASWLQAADAYYEASIDPEGVEIAIPMIWGIDAVHGHANLTGAIVFPHNIGLGAANDPDLVKRIAAVTATELSVSGHDWTFAPTLAVPQNDRWGRGYEGFSEDPALVKSYGGAIVQGLQGKIGTEEFMSDGKVISTAKHFLGDGGTENGVDQGDAVISETELRDIHLAGYLTAIEDGAQSVMASFSAWQGQRMHGQKELLTDVLKGQMNFKGFVVGDWNGHALIPGCTQTDCPQSFNAGLDMYMTPDTWKGMYESTLRHVKSGEIPMERLEDAVRRILRVKINSGIFEKAKPSERIYSGKTEFLGSATHRDLAREAVRKSAVLIKNNDSILPLKAGSRVHVVGAGADHIGKFSGGWTLDWQGGNYANDQFPNGETFLAAVKREVAAGGGSVSYDPTGNEVPKDVDVVIAVYGEDPYAEFQGDRDHVDFTPNDFNPDLLNRYSEAGLPVVSLFLSGRPLWTNSEINASDAFIAAWLPGSEPAGLTDLIFQTNPEYDFTGRLSFSWPKTATQVKLNAYHDDYDPLFKLGYGLSYESGVNLDELSVESGLPAIAAVSKGIFFEKGKAVDPWRIAVNGVGVERPYQMNGLQISAYDKDAQEDAFRVKSDSNGDIMSIKSAYALDFQREINGAMELSFDVKSLSGPSELKVGMNDSRVKVQALPEWKTVYIPMSCVTDTHWVEHAFAIESSEALDVAVANVKIVQESGKAIACE